MLPLFLVTYTELGCWKDTSVKAIPSLESESYLLTGAYASRKMAIRKCAVVAYLRNFTAFALQVNNSHILEFLVSYQANMNSYKIYDSLEWRFMCWFVERT